MSPAIVVSAGEEKYTGDLNVPNQLSTGVRVILFKINSSPPRGNLSDFNIRIASPLNL